MSEMDIVGKRPFVVAAAWICTCAAIALLVEGQQLTTMIPIPQFEEDGIKCLRMVKEELNDMEGVLLTWNFAKTTRGSTCDFTGVQCWHNDDDRLLSLKLQGMDLSCQFPDGVKYCGSMTNLDLSSNYLSNTIPPQLCRWLPYLVNLDLSNNNFHGPIPAELAECIYLNRLDLSGNALSGTVPWRLSLLRRLRDFDVSRNHLSGALPSAFRWFDATSFENNHGLCGSPLLECKEGPSTAVVVCSTLAVLIVVTILCFGVWWGLMSKVLGTLRNGESTLKDLVSIH